MEQRIQTQYERWLERAETSVAAELREISGNPEKIEDAFYQGLSFGTGGLRGVLGAGPNRMNLHTVARASQGLANYLIAHFSPDRRSVAVSYDSRLQSDEFAKIASGVFATNGIKVWIFSELMPTPCLSFAVRKLDCAAGIMITASHNPARYNGYKVYNADGCQITVEEADGILSEIQCLDYFDDVRSCDFAEAVSTGQIRYVPESVVTAYISAVKQESEFSIKHLLPRDCPIVYSPLNGTGLKPVLRVLGECGYTNVSVVKEQEQPDGRFPTCPRPNPEQKEAMALGIECAERVNAEFLLATDPDCDRVGVAVRRAGNDYVLLSGNEVGVLLLDYICSQLRDQDRMPPNPVFIKTIVTTDLGERIAEHYGLRTINVLTGFKYIGEQIGFMERSGHGNSFVFGFEESCGYLKGNYARDKDAVLASLLVCEMHTYYRSRGISLLDKLEELYQTYGYWLNDLLSYEIAGPSGTQRIQAIMEHFRRVTSEIAGIPVIQTEDYLHGLEGLPKADVLKLHLEGKASVIIRPSGTEPKLKVYLSVCGRDADSAKRLLENVQEKVGDMVEGLLHRSVVPTLS